MASQQTIPGTEHDDPADAELTQLAIEYEETTAKTKEIVEGRERLDHEAHASLMSAMQLHGRETFRYLAPNGRMMLVSIKIAEPKIKIKPTGEQAGDRVGSVMPDEVMPAGLDALIDSATEDDETSAKSKRARKTKSVLDEARERQAEASE